MILTRWGNTPFGVFGTLVMPSGMEFYTVEQPWRNNARGESCIPPGEYMLRQRASPIVKRTSGHDMGWEVVDVPGRTFIMIHVANRAAELQGCIAPGTGLGLINGEWAVTSSRAALNAIYDELATKPEWQLNVRWN